MSDTFGSGFFGTGTFGDPEDPSFVPTPPSLADVISPPIAIPPAHKLRFISWEGSVVEFDPGALPRLLMEMEGFSSTSLNVQTRKSQSQHGESLDTVSVQAKTASIKVALGGADRAEYWDLRKQLVKACAIPRTKRGKPAKYGMLQVVRAGQPLVECPAVPINSPKESDRPDRYTVIMDLDFYLPNPYWRTPELNTHLFQTSGGFHFTLEFPIEIGSLNIRQDINNVGDVEVPVLMRFQGQMDNPKFVNETTGEQMRLAYSITADDGRAVEIHTGYGKKFVQAITSGGVRSNIVGKVDFATSEFWQLAPGVNTIAFAADVNTSGRAFLTWRPEWAGL